MNRKEANKIIEKHSAAFGALPREAIEAIEYLINAEPQKMGHWINYQKNIWIYAQCSECGTVHDTQTNYCPNCGAKMAEGSDKE